MTEHSDKQLSPASETVSNQNETINRIRLETSSRLYLLKLAEALTLGDQERAERHAPLVMELANHFNQIFGCFLDGSTPIVSLRLPTEEYAQNGLDDTEREKLSKVGKRVKARYNHAIEAIMPEIKDVSELRQKSKNDLLGIKNVGPDMADFLRTAFKSKPG